MQVVGYDTGVSNRDAEWTHETTSHAALLLGTDGTVDREPLIQGRDLEFTLGERHCAGTVRNDRHVPCDAAKAPYCAQHTDRWPCARCRGDCDLPLESCREEHAVYLAGFAPAAFKVGVTRSWRLETRLREQGADRGAHIRTVSNGRAARQIEADIAERVGDSVRVDRKRSGLHQSVEEGAWNRLLDDFDVIERFTFECGLELTERPVAETLLSGTVRGTKGRLLVLERGGSVYGVDRRDLVGYEVSEGATDRQLQASLGSFE